jgi:hypothetical protein
MPIVKRFLSAIGLTFPFGLAVWQAGVRVQPLSPLNSPSVNVVGNIHVQGMNHSMGSIRIRAFS